MSSSANQSSTASESVASPAPSVANNRDGITDDALDVLIDILDNNGKTKRKEKEKSALRHFDIYLINHRKRSANDNDSFKKFNSFKESYLKTYVIRLFLGNVRLISLYMRGLNQRKTVLASCYL